MCELAREDLIGRRITELVISVPDKPITMSTMSRSTGYLRLDTDVLVPIGHPPTLPIRSCAEAAISDLVRDYKYEREFMPVLQQQIRDVVVTRGDGCLCFATDNFLITEVPAQFWIRPCLYKRDQSAPATVPFWRP